MIRWSSTFLLLCSLPVVLLAEEADPQNHWAFKSPRRSEMPAVANPDWVRNPIDAFILQRLRAAQIVPSPEEERAALLRRVTYDLTGLVPTPTEVEDFLKDPRPDAYERVVDRLLASPHHGERWATHWLDVARYAESNGYELDAERPHAWRYRDYVIRSLNQDKPYDRFLTEQVAGDLLARQQKDNHELLIAAGFNRCGPIHVVGGNVDPAVLRQEFLTEVANSIGTVFLGLTFGCARCHDHKFDPITQADYFSLQAFFNPVTAREADIASPQEQEAYRKEVAAINSQIEPIKKELATLEAPYRKKVTDAKRAALEPHFRTALDLPVLKRSPAQILLAMQAQTLIKVSWDELVEALSPADRERRAALRRAMHALEARKPHPPAQAWTLEEKEGPHRIHILKRGDPLKKGDEVSAGYPVILGGQTSEKYDRLELARWLTRPDHPLTARVIVNRLWQHHFGRGIVASSGDFGIRGDKPSHPELLDWLATELIRQGWSLKALHRIMVTSATYRQASRGGNAIAEQKDPENRLLWKMNRRRMEAEGIRDVALQVGGGLHRTLYGPQVRIPLEPEVYDLIFTEGEPDNLWPVTADLRQHDRRSLYLFVKRNVRLPLLETFDQPDTLTACPVRAVSTFAPQALHLMNGPFLRQQAQRMTTRLLKEAGTDPEQQIEQAFRIALGRPPRPQEKALVLDFLREQQRTLEDRLRARLPLALPEGVPDGLDPAAVAALADFCLALLNGNEFLYIR